MLLRSWHFRTCIRFLLHRLPKRHNSKRCVSFSSRTSGRPEGESRRLESKPQARFDEGGLVMDWLLRHRRTKGAGTDRSIPGGAGSSSLLDPIFIIFLLASVVFPVPAWAASDVHVQIRRIQQERMHLKAVREKLESRRGQLGRSLKKLDRALVRASISTRQATGAVRQADVRLADLTAKRSRLEQRVDVLKRRKDHGVCRKDHGVKRSWGLA